MITSNNPSLTEQSKNRMRDLPAGAKIKIAEFLPKVDRAEARKWSAEVYRGIPLAEHLILEIKEERRNGVEFTRRRLAKKRNLHTMQNATAVTETLSTDPSTNIRRNLAANEKTYLLPNAAKIAETLSTDPNLSVRIALASNSSISDLPNAATIVKTLFTDPNEWLRTHLRNNPNIAHLLNT